MEEMEKPKRSSKLVLWMFLGFIGVSAIALVVIGIATAPSDEEIAARDRRDSIATARTLDSVRVIHEEHERRMKTDRKYRDSVVAEEKRAAKEAEDELRRTNPSAYVDVSARWKKGGFGTVALATVTIKNRSLKKMSDAIIKFEFTTESGTILGTRTEVIGRVWEPGQTKSSEEINLGFIDKQATNMSYELVNAVWSEPDASQGGR